MSDAFDVLLVGAGHTHLGVLRQWASEGHPPAGRIGLVSAEPHAWYSGMMPGMVAEEYLPEQCRIALAPLCKAAGVRLIVSAARSLEADSRSLILANRRRVQGAWLSLNVGSAPRLPRLDGPTLELLPVKPFARFAARWQHWQWQPLPIAIIGGGLAGVELALVMAPQVPAVTLFGSGPLLKDQPKALRRRALRHLQDAGVEVREGCRIEAVRGDALIADGAEVWRGLRVVVASGAHPLPWLNGCGLQGERFIEIRPTLQSVSHARIFAAGDCASLADTPHSGVYAVRQAPVLAENLRRAPKGEALLEYRPQRLALALMHDGQDGALLSWAGLTAEGSIMRLWKDHLDRRFVEQHRDVQAR